MLRGAAVARGQTPQLHWSETERAWISSVRFPNGSRKPVKRVNKEDAQADLDRLLVLRASGGTAPQKDAHLITFDEAFDAWIVAGCPAAGITVDGKKRSRRKQKRSLGTQRQAIGLLRTHVRPTLGKLKIDRTLDSTVEECFDAMETRIRGNAGKNATAADTLAYDTIYHTWNHAANAIEFTKKRHRNKTNPVLDVQLPTARDPKERRSFQLDTLETIIRAILLSSRAAMWLTGLMCGLRPGELSGLRWNWLDLDGATPTLYIEERAHYEVDKYIDQRDPKRKSNRAIELPALTVAVLQKHRDDMKALGLYEVIDEKYAPRGFVFPVTVARSGTAKRQASRVGLPMTLGNVRKYFREFVTTLELGDDWTTYELRHSFTSLAEYQLNDLRAVADVVGHVSTRTTLGYQHAVTRQAVSGARLAFEGLLATHGMTATPEPPVTIDLPVAG